jgi:acyl carrier protein phosphodiesterase
VLQRLQVNCDDWMTVLNALTGFKKNHNAANSSFIYMNFLAHAYLSFDQPGILVGNMISDFVKGSAKFDYNPEIQKGIELHRNIDEFTDKHPATLKAKEIFRPHYRLYSGAIMDVLYDHFLANDSTLFPDRSLQTFSNRVYQTLERQTASLPPVFVQVLTYMKADDWLYNYRTQYGIQRSLNGLVRRAVYLTESKTAFDLFNVNYEMLRKAYEDFFPDVKKYAKERLKALLT